MPLIYHMANAADWKIAEATGEYNGSADDLRDGFIHFSTAEQVAVSAERHRKGQDNLMLLACDRTLLGPKLKWETSRGGALFPHLYRKLLLTDVLSARPLPMRADGSHDFSGLLEGGAL